MKTKRLFLYLLTLFMSITSVWAGLPAFGTTKTGTPESGKKYYIYADTYSGGKYVNRYLYNDNGTLKTSATPDESNDFYVWTCTVTNGKYTFQNVGNTAKYLAHKGLADAAYNFTLGKANATHEGTPIWSDGASRYFVTKNDGSAFDQSTGTYNQANDTWCTDYVFVEYVVPAGNQLQVTTNITGAGELLVNGTATSLPYTKWENTVTLPVTLTATANNIYNFEGFYINGVNKGKEWTVESLSENVTIEARYSYAIFSTSFENGVPVQIYNTGNTSYAIKMNAADNYSGKAVNSGTIAWDKNETWVLVGNASSFKMYNTVAGKDYAIKLSGTGRASAATLVAASEATELCITEVNGNYAISPVGNTAQSFNMHGGAGADIKLYDTTDSNSKWNFRKIDMSKALTLQYNAQLEGGYEQNYKIGEITTTINGVASKRMLEKSSIPASSTCYLPEGSTFGISTGLICHGWTIDINGNASIENQTIPAGGLTVNVNIAVDTNNKYQYLHYSPGPGGHPYRIPAIATTANGYVFAINDFRPCNADIGNGDVDLVMRYSTAAGSEWDGYSWTDEIKIADGEGHAAHNRGETWKVGFGDPAVVADRENNEILVMSVCGNRLCWDGNYGAGTADNPENPNRISRIRIKFNDKTKQWEVGEPKEVTYDIYPLFKDENKVYVGSMFIGAGRIAQSSKIKVGTHFRIYCAVWAVETGSGRYHNYAIYSDNFGESWKVLGELGWDNCPAKYGNEPKCEELPDGSVLLSSRKGYGRYFNVFRYTDAEKGEGAWMGEVSTDQVGDLKWGSNDTNGEPLRIGNVLFQSAPTGNGRSDVAVFYKVLSNNPDDYTPTKLSNGWTKIAISDKSSAYSSMCILPDGENIGFFYEEWPSDYSMVYVPLILKDILPADVYAALSALPPTYASEKTPVWHSIRFSGTGNVLSDCGAGNNAATVVATEEVDANMWNIVGTKEQFYLVSKLGNYLAYNATTKRYYTTANKSEKAALTLKENIKGSWEIMRKGATKSLCEVAVSRSTSGEITEGTICGEGNQIAFNDLTPAIYEPNIFSTEKAPVYYQVIFQNGKWALADKGNGNEVKTATNDSSSSAQLWQFIGKPESFYMKSKDGNWLGFASNFYKATTSENKVELALFKTNNSNYAGAYEIKRLSASNCMNMYQGAGNDKSISEWTAGDGGNPVKFIEENIEVADITAQYFSTEAEPTYWWVQFNKGSAVIKDQGNGEKVITATKAYENAQLWQLVGDKNSFYMKNKAGNYLTWNGSRFATSNAADSKATLILHESDRAEGCYEIQLSGNSYMNQNGGAGSGKELGTWNKNDENNPLTFISTAPAWPTFSDNKNEYWYFIKFGNGGWTIDDKGAGNNVQTTSLNDYDTQKWKLTGTKDNCQIISKAGHYLVYNNNKIQASNSADTQGFKLVATENSSYPQHIEIQHKSATDKAFNMDGGAGNGKSISLYNSNNGGNPLLFVAVESVNFPEFSMGTSSATAPEEKLTLWYTQPATATGVSNTWMEYSLPLGNGQFGASLFGGVAKDQILFNDKALWSGGPTTYGNYLPFGSIYIEDISGDFTFNPTKPVQNYYRDLNLKTATGTVTYENGEGVKFTRQYIASNPDNAIVTKITASEAGKLNLRFTMEAGKPTVNAETTYENGYAAFTGKLQTVSYNATMRVIAKGGYTSTGAEGITVEEADEVLVILAGCTDFIGNDASHHNGRADYLPADNKAIVDAVAKKGWDAVYAAHVADHQEYFCRVNLELDGVENNLPTNELIAAYNAASGSSRNLMLEQLYYNYGRYLSIASSRGIDLPNNLQGIWNNSCTPPWNSDIHANINVQMNYWPVSAGNLNEMYEPFLNYIINEAAQPEWKAKAQQKGATREDSWTMLTENNIFGGFGTFQGDALINNAWYVTHLWQHYRYTLDADYLKRAFPAMKGASLFWVDRMVYNTDDDTYECPNEYSPEHGPNENATSHAQQIVWECIDNTIKAADKLGAVAAGLISQEDYNLLLDRREKMDRGLRTEEYNGKWGDGWGITTGDLILREWKYTSTFDDGKGIERGHRHMSHLMALFPFSQLTPASEFFVPAINSMKLRGDESTGWSMGWKINLWARALMGDRSHAILRKALKHSTTYGTDQGQGGIYYNLYDSHAPFQIDGNFGATSGINEMLLQSHTEVIDILPALPTEWSKGSVKGLKAIGDFTVDIIWEGNQAKKVTITNNQGQPCYVKCTGLSAATVTVNGAAVTLGEEIVYGGLPCYQIASNAGDKIVIDLSNAIQNNKSALEALIEETKELLNDCYDYYATEVALQTTDVSSDFYISTNADHNEHNPGSPDGGGIAALVDGNNENFLHTNWNGSNTTITEPHRIDINLGENNATSSFKFKYATRKAQTDFPKTIEITGSNDGSNYYPIATVTNLPVGNERETKFYESGVIESETAYSYLRFTVTATNSGNKANNLLYWHMAEFDLMPRTAEPVVNYDGALVPAAAENAKTEVANATVALDATQTTVEYKASLAALQTAYDELVAAIASGNLPVLLTLDANKPIVYKIGIKRDTNTVLEYDLASTKKVAVANYNESNIRQGWYFTKGSADGKVFIHPYVGGGDVLGANSTANNPGTVWAAVKGSTTHEEWQILVVNQENGTYNIKAGDNSNYFSNNGGTGNKMGFWSGSNTTDTGSLFTFTRIDFDGGVWYNTLNTYKTLVCTKESVADGTEPGYYLYGAAYNTARAEAVTTLENVDATENDYKNAYTALRAANEAMEFIALQTGHYYRISNNGYYITGSTTSGGRIALSSTKDANAIYYYDGSHLLSYSNGLYIGLNTSDWTFEAVGTAESDISAVTFSEGSTQGTFSINCGGRWLHNSDNAYVNRCQNNTCGAAHSWAIEEVVSLPVTITSAGYATFYAPVEVSFDDVKAYYTIGEKADNYIKMVEIEDGIIPANEGVILKGNEGTYNLDIAYDSESSEIADNLLTGTIAKTLITKESGNAYYILGLNSNNEPGMYNPVNGNDTNTFYNAGHKAYMVEEGAAQAIGYSFSFDWSGTTGIEDITTTETTEEATIYDLQGRKLNTITAPGFYIVNGKKVYVK